MPLASIWPPGTIVAGRFEIEELAGRGGMSQVFRARDRQNGALVALKLLALPGPDKLSLERFLREAQLLAELRHPNIVGYVAHGQPMDGQAYLAMEWLAGEDLRQRLRRGRLGVAESLQLARKVAEVLAMLHGRGILHRDIKPSNLFLRGGHIDQVVLLDFGVARRPPGLGPKTRTGEVVGTLQYLSPEQARSERRLGPATDIYSLGCVLFECLTGEPPFHGDHPGVVLARILCEEAPLLGQLRPELPAALESLLARMLNKRPADRPAHAQEILDALAPLEHSEALPEESAPARRPALMGVEQRLVSVILAAPPEANDAEPSPPLPEDEPPTRQQHEELIELLASCGARAEVLATGTLLALLSQSSMTAGMTANDQAMQAIRCALLIQEYLPRAVVALAMGRGALASGSGGGGTGGEPTGEALERAMRLLDRRALGSAQGSTGLVVLDELAARLLDGRFRVRQIGSGAFELEGERTKPNETRMLLGRPTPCVGREQELVQLEMLFDGCTSDRVARAVLVTGPPGKGKSRLRQEFVRRLQGRSEPVEILLGSGDPMPGEPMGGLIGQALRRLAGVEDGSPLEQRRERLAHRLGRHLTGAEHQTVLEFLGELCGVPFADHQSPQLGAARQDPRLMNERIGEALLTLLQAECAAQTVVLVLEDLHWSDAATLRLVDRALRKLGEQPFFVFGISRSEIHEQFPGLWQERNVQEIRLPPLSRKASERLVRKILGEEVEPRTLQRIVEQAGGNALFLEELIRAVAEGAGEELPETVLAMMQARFLRLDPGARRVLRAASILGTMFWRGGVAALLGIAVPVPREGEGEGGVAGSVRSAQGVGPAGELDRWFHILVDAEITRAHEESRFPGEAEYSFRHALLRDAAYSLLTEADRQTGHGLAGDYLARMGETDPMVLGEHYRLSGEPGRAAVFYAHAAEQALAVDTAEALRRAELGIACGAAGEVLGRLHAIAAHAHLWRSNLGAALAAGLAGLVQLPPGCVAWYGALNAIILVAGFQGRRDLMAEHLRLLASVAPLPGAEAAYFEQSTGGIFVLSQAGPSEELRDLLERTRLVNARLSGNEAGNEALVRGWFLLGEVTYDFFIQGDPVGYTGAAQEAVALLTTAGNHRIHAVAQAYVCAGFAELGEPGRAVPLAREALESVRRHDDFLVLGVIKGLLAFALATEGGPEAQAEALSLGAEVIAESPIPNFWAGLAQSARALARLAQGDPAAAEDEARKALALMATSVPGRLLALALLCRALLARGPERIAEACQVADEGQAALEVLGTACHDVRLLVAAAEAHHAAGGLAAAEKARALAARACRRFEQLAARVDDPALRERYLGQAEYVRACELAG